MPPQIILRAADARPFELQDLLPSDTRFKILFFAGNLDSEYQRGKLASFAQAATAENGFLRKYGRGANDGWGDIFELITIVCGKKESVDYTTVPAVLRSHWSK